MRWITVAAAGLTALSLLPPAGAWNGTGHKIVAAVAYDALKPSTRARVDDLIRRHPDYERLFLQDAPGDPHRRARAAFLNASVWADQIRSDPRFYDEDRRAPRPTPLLPGFPDMARHASWHYINLPFSQDGTPLRDPPKPNAVTEIERLARAVARPVGDPANPVYALPWLIHLVGDLHNPVHAVARFSREYPQGDRGGNDVLVKPGRNLHAFWDGQPGPDPATWPFIEAVIQQLPSVRVTGPAIDPVGWAQEGLELARREVYTFGPRSGTPARPVTLSQRYLENAKSLSREQLAKAGLRLAALLNQQLP
jgi:hypothetical protein